MAAKALLCKIKIDVWKKKKKTMGEKWPVSQQPSPTIPPLAPPLFMLRQRMRPPSLPETGVKGQHGPLDISYDNTSGCVLRVCVCVCLGGGIPTWERQSKTRWTMREMRSKKLAGLEGTDHKISMQVICFEIHLHDSCPWLSSPCCSLLSKNLLF